MKARYSKTAQKEVAHAMHEHKHSGKYENRKQAIAVGLSEARRKGAHLPEERGDA